MITIKQHKELAENLRAARDMLLDIECTKKHSTKISKIDKKLSTVMSELDNIVCKDNPYDDSVLTIYFGKEREKVKEELRKMKMIARN